MAKRKQEDFKVTWAVGSVFADLGLPDAPLLERKAGLLSAIYDVVEDRGMTQVEVSKLTGISQGNVSRLLSGHLESFSTDRLLDVLGHLNFRAQLVLKPITKRTKHNARFTVVLAH